MDIVSLGANSSAGTVARKTISPAVASSATAASSATDPGNQLTGVGSSDFLKLLVAEMKNQDPMKPLDDKDFFAQVTQLNTVQQITQMNQNLGQFLGLEQMAQASNLIGKTIEAQPAGKEAIDGIVTQVKLAGTYPVLIVNGQELRLSDVQTISSASAK